MNLELSVLARMAGQGASGIHLPPLSHIWGYRRMLLYSAVTSMLEIWTHDLMFVQSSLYSLNNSPTSDQPFFNDDLVALGFCLHDNFSSLIWIPPKHPRMTSSTVVPQFFSSPPTVSILLTTRYHAPKIGESGIYLNRPTLFQWLHPASNPMVQDLLSNVARTSCYLKACIPIFVLSDTNKVHHTGGGVENK